MKERLEALSAGGVTIDIHPRGVLESELQAIERLENGTRAMSKTQVPLFPAMIAALMVTTDMPKLSRWRPVKTGQLEAEVLDRPPLARLVPQEVP